MTTTSPTTTATTFYEYSEDNKENWDPNLKMMRGVGGVSSNDKTPPPGNHVVLSKARQKSLKPLKNHQMSVSMDGQRRPLSEVTRKYLLNMR